METKTIAKQFSQTNKTLKQIIPNIIKELTICINKSFQENKFPEILKISKITPLHKKNDKTNPSNYRPIAQLSPLSKTMEQLCMTQLHEFFESQNTINNRQFGFRKAHSTIHPLLSVKAYIEQKLQNNEFIIL